MLSGYKTYIGALIMAISAGLNYLGHTELGEAFKVFGFALMGTGLGHKLAKATNGK